VAGILTFFVGAFRWGWNCGRARSRFWHLRSPFRDISVVLSLQSPGGVCQVKTSVF